MTNINFLAVLDFDGTSDDGNEIPKIHPKIQEAITKSLSHDWRWAINSDRNRKELIRIATSLPPEIRPIAIIAQRRSIELIDPNGIYQPHMVWNNDHHNAETRLWKQFVPFIETWRKNVTNLFQVRLDLTVKGILGFIVTPSDVPRLFTYLSELVADIPDAVVSYNHESCFVVHRSFCKGTACRELTRLIGLQRTQVGTIGDAMNDLPMLETKTAGFAGCPESASEEVKKYVSSRHQGFVAKSTGAAGSAEVLNEWLQSC